MAKDEIDNIFYFTRHPVYDNLYFILSSSRFIMLNLTALTQSLILINFCYTHVHT